MPAKKPSGKNTGQKTRFGKKQAAIILWAMIAAVLAVLVAFGAKAYRNDRPLLEVDGYKISREEYSWAMFAARDDVLSVHAAAGISPIQWGTETELGMPYEMVAEQAVQILREYYAVSALAEERGYLEDGSFTALQEQLERENRQRAEAIAAGEIITGLSSYDLEQYIAYRTAGLRRQFCDDDRNPEMLVTDDEIRRRYETDKASLYIMEDSLSLNYIEIFTAEEEASAAWEADVRLLRQAVLDGSSLEEAVKSMPRLQEFYQELRMDGENYAAYARGYADLLAYSAKLQTGDVSEVICEGGVIFLIECIERIDNDYQPLENVYAVVERSIQEERYDALIAERTQQIKAAYDAADLYAYTAQRLGLKTD